MTVTALFDPEAEKAVLGAMLNYPVECCEIALSRLKPSDFAQNDLRRIFTVLGSEYASGKQGELVGLVRALKDPSLNNVIKEVVTASGVPGNLTGFIQAVKAKSDLRRIHSLGEAIQRKALNDDSLVEIITEAEREIEGILSGWTAGGWTGEKPWDDYHKMVTAPADEKSDVLVTGFGHLDSYVKMRGSYVISIGAVQKTGKSTFAKDLAIRWWDQGIKGEIISLEMKLPDYQTLIISSVTGISRDDLEARNLSPELINKMMRSLHRVKRWPWTIHDPHRLNTTQFRAIAKEAARKGARFLVVDYLQLMDCDGGPRERHLQLEEISRIIKQTALETNLLIVALSQLNAKALTDAKGNPIRPTLAHLRGTGAIAQDADVVILLHEPEPDKLSFGKRRITAQIEANRRGPRHDLYFLFDGAHARFSEA